MNAIQEFRGLRSDELDTGYALHLEAYEWLKSRGSSQWAKPFPYEKYRLWHGQRLNYGFFSNGTLTSVLSIVEETDDRWHDYLQGRSVLWVVSYRDGNRVRPRGKSH